MNDIQPEATDDIPAHLTLKTSRATDEYRFSLPKTKHNFPNVGLLLNLCTQFPLFKINIGFTIYTVRIYIPIPKGYF